MDPSLFSHIAPVLQIRDLKATVDFYTDKLGFTVSYRHGSPVDYAVLRMGDAVAIHMAQNDAHHNLEQSYVSLYIFVHDVDKVYEEYQKRDVNITCDIGDREYKMRDFDVTDPNGFVLCFGERIGREKKE